MMDASGKIGQNPVPLRGIKSVNDLEAIVPAGNDLFYLVSSQNISKKGKRPKSREQIIRLKRNGNNLTVTGRVHFLSTLRESYSMTELTALGLEKFEKDAQPVLNIEGAAFYQNALYLGLKEPVAANGTIIWKLDDVETLFDTNRLAPGQLTLNGHVQLGQHKNNTASISVLLFLALGVLWALSTIANVDEEDQLGGFHRIKQFSDGHLEAERIFEFPGLKPEGLCLQGSNRFVIVFDNDNNVPAFCYVDSEAL
jgi:hypothetical protein